MEERRGLFCLQQCRVYHGEEDTAAGRVGVAIRAGSQLVTLHPNLEEQRLNKKLGWLKTTRLPTPSVTPFLPEVHRPPNSPTMWGSSVQTPKSMEGISYRNYKSCLLATQSCHRLTL